MISKERLKPLIAEYFSIESTTVFHGYNMLGSSENTLSSKSIQNIQDSQVDVHSQEAGGLRLGREDHRKED